MTELVKAWYIPFHFSAYVRVALELVSVVILEILHDVSAVLLSIVGFNAIVLSVIYLIVSRRKVERPADPVEWPSVVVQLPIYNELHVVERLVDAISRLTYPRDKLTVQLLDDSTD